jgi:hypothetical protein
MNNNPSSTVAHNRVPFPHGTTPALKEPELLGGGGGGGEENGSDIEISLIVLQRMERVT